MSTSASSGTQVAFSRLQLRRLGEDLTSRYIVVSRDTLFESEVALTPYTDDLQIDAVALADARRRVRRRGAPPEDVDTGVVILTGEALRRRNAERDRLASSRSGRVTWCARPPATTWRPCWPRTAREPCWRRTNAGSRILNVDIGGGTTKLALIDHGRVLATAAFHVGGRLIAVDGDTVSRLEPGGRRHAAAVGLDLSLGSRRRLRRHSTKSRARWPN